MGEQPLILVVDDSVGIGRLVTKMLHTAGYQTSYASTGTEALKHIENIRPDLILLDYHMPDIDGLEVIRRVRAVGDDTPIILASATSQEEARRLHIASVGLGADDFVAKPFTFQALTTHIKARLQKKPA